MIRGEHDFSLSGSITILVIIAARFLPICKHLSSFLDVGYREVNAELCLGLDLSRVLVSHLLYSEQYHAHDMIAHPQNTLVFLRAIFCS